MVPLFADGGVAGNAEDVAANREAWEVLRRWDRPFLTAFSDKDPVTRGAHRRFQAAVPGASSVQHVTIRGAGHFLQEEKPNELVDAIVTFINGTPRAGPTT